MSDYTVGVAIDSASAEQGFRRLADAAQRSSNNISSAFDRAGYSVSKFDSTLKKSFQNSGFDQFFTKIRTNFTAFIAVVGLASTAVISLGRHLIETLNKIQGFQSIMRVSTTSVAQANEQYSFLENVANKLGIQFTDLLSNYSKLLAAIPEGNDRLQKAQNVFIGLSMAARTLHASNVDTQLMFYAVTQMASKGTVSMEELRRQLGERLPGAMQIAANSIGVTTDELENLVRKGVVDSSKFIKFFGDELIRTFAGSAEAASQTIDASINRLTNVWIKFVKYVLDSGAGQKIVGIFEALTEKLSDPAIMATFAALVDDVATNVTKFVKSLTREDIRNGFDSFANGVRTVVYAVESLVKGLMWVINNATAVGAVMGALKGASAGAVAGSVIPGVGTAVGAAVGGAAGLVAGGTIGYQIQKGAPQMGSAAGLSAGSYEAQIAKEREQWINAGKTYIINALGQETAGAANHLAEKIYEKLGPDEFMKALDSALSKTSNGKSVYRDKDEGLKRIKDLIDYGTILGPRGTVEDVLKASDKKGKSTKTREPAWQDQLKAEEQYIKTMQSRYNTAQKLTEVEKLNLDIIEGRVTFHAEENYFKALAVAKARDQLAEEEKIAKAKEKANEYIKRANFDNEKQIYLLGEELRNLTLSNRERKIRADYDKFEMKVAEQIMKAPKEAQGDMINQAPEMLRKYEETLRRVAEETYAWYTGAWTAINDLTEKYSNDAAHMSNFMSQTFQSLENSFVSLMTTGKFTWKNLADTIIGELARIASQRAILNPLMQVVAAFMPTPSFANTGMGLGGGTGISFPRNFSKGGVFTSEIMFPTRSGSGRMAEAGPEAIIPLHRSGDGSLGVSAAGVGSTPVTVNVINNAQGTEVQTQESTGPDGSRVIDVMVEQSVNKAIGAGRFDRAFNNFYGISRQGRK